MYKTALFSLIMFLTISVSSISAEINPQLKNPDFNFLFSSAANLAKPYQEREADRKLLNAHIDDFKEKLLDKLKSKNLIEKQIALSVIETSGKTDFEQPVIDVLQSGNILVKESAAHALFNIYKNMTFKELLKRTVTFKDENSDNEEFILPAIFGALAENNYQLKGKLLSTIITAAKKEKPALNRACLNLFIKQKSKSAKNEIFEALQTILKKTNNELYQADIAEMFYIFDTNAVPLLQKMINNDNAYVQIASAFSLAKIGDSAGLDLLHQALLVNNVSLKLKTISYLKEIKSPFSEKHLAANLASPNRTVCIKSAEALGSLEGCAITPGLRRLLQDSDMKVVSAAAIALKNQGALGIHWRLINSSLASIKNERKVISAINTLGKMKSMQAESRLHELIFSENKNIAAAAAHALGEIKAKEKKTHYGLIQVMGSSSHLLAINAAEALQKITHLPFLKNPEQSVKTYKETLKKNK